MYRIAIFKIQPEPDITGYQTNYPAGTGTGYLGTCCIIANFLVYFIDTIKNVIIPCVCFQLCVLTHCIGLQLIQCICKTVGLHDSLLVSHVDQ